MRKKLEKWKEERTNVEDPSDWLLAILLLQNAKSQLAKPEIKLYFKDLNPRERYILQKTCSPFIGCRVIHRPNRTQRVPS